MRNILLKLCFDGSSYHGSQRQLNAQTVQECLEEAIFKLSGEKSTITSCSRTDAGVHAREFYCNFKTSSSIPAKGLTPALNHLLPSDIAIFEASDVADDFSSRANAKRKEYQYIILNSEIRNPFYEKRAWHYPNSLDISDMKRATFYLTGTHDFSAFTDVGGQTKTNIRTVFDIQINKKGDLFYFNIQGDGFLYHMVRIMVGSLVYTGRGKIRPDQMGNILKSLDRKNAGPTAPAEGLYLNRVHY